MKSRYTSLFVTIFVMVFMYLPIVMLVSQSFNESRYGGKWMGFSLKWYEALFKDSAVINATLNTLIVAFAATVISTAVGTCAAWTLNKYRLSKLQSAHYVLVYAPMCVPDVLMGISLLLMFVSMRVDLGLTTVILAHATFCLSFVTFTVRGQFQDIRENRPAAFGAWNSGGGDDGVYSFYGRLCRDVLCGRPGEHNPAREGLQHDEARPAGDNKRPERRVYGADVHRGDSGAVFDAQKVLTLKKG